MRAILLLVAVAFGVWIGRSDPRQQSVAPKVIRVRNAQFVMPVQYKGQPALIAVPADNRSR